MPASEDMMQEQLNGIIARMELRVEQKCVRANALAPPMEWLRNAR